MSLCVAAAAMCLLFGLHLQETKADLSDATCNFTVLEKSLFENEANKIQLSLAFFPLQDNPPEFVKVTYSFGSNTQVWFWSGHNSHFLHPFEVLQFMSLFFGKPEPFFTGTLTLTLRPDCADPGRLPNGNPRLQLLTQRLKLYAEKGNPGITLSDTYRAKAYNNDTLFALLDNDAKHTANLIICMAVFVIFFSAFIIIMMLIVFLCSKSHTHTKWAEKVQKNKPAVLSFTFLSFLLNAYILSLTCAAIIFWYNNTKNSFLYSFYAQKYNLGPIYTLLVVDILGFISWFVLVFIAGCRKCNDSRGVNQKKEDAKNVGRAEVNVQNGGGANGNEEGGGGAKRDNKSKVDKIWLILSSTVLCPIFCVIAHSPYIAIAYLNDGSHASSIFIYYTILCYLFFGVMLLFFNWYQKYFDPVKAENASSEEKQSCWSDIKSRLIFIIPLGIAVLLLLGLVVTIACYLVLIPINKSISDAPSRVLSIYQSGGFLIGSFIVYKVLKYFYNKKNEEEDTA